MKRGEFVTGCDAAHRQRLTDQSRRSAEVLQRTRLAHQQGTASGQSEWQYLPAAAEATLSAATAARATAVQKQGEAETARRRDPDPRRGAAGEERHLRV